MSLFNRFASLEVFHEECNSYILGDPSPYTRRLIFWAGLVNNRIITYAR